MVLDLYEQYFSAEMEANGRPRHGALVKLTSDSEGGKIHYQASVSFFPHDTPEDFAVSYDAAFSKTLYEGDGRRSKKREAELMELLRDVIDEIAAQPKAFAETPGDFTAGKVFWDQPLREARGEYELPAQEKEKEERKVSRKNFGAKPLSYPQPVWIIATYDEDGVPDAMNAAWGGISEENEVSVCLSVGHKTCKNFEKTGAFTISMADAAHVAACDYVGMASGNQTADKFARAGFTAARSELVNAPIINELAVCLECKVKEFDHETCILKGEIVNVSVDESCLTDGKVDVAKVQPIAFDPFNNAYHVLGEKVGEAWSSGKALL